jgi:hypothetical protein
MAEDSILDRIWYSINKPSSWALGHLSSGISGEKYDEKKEYVPLDFKTSVGKQLFPNGGEQLKSLSFGHYDGGKNYFENFIKDPAGMVRETTGDLIDTGVDTGIGFATDPLNYLPITKVAKLGKDAGRMLVGALLGANAADKGTKSDDFISPLMGAGVGALTGKYMPSATKAGAKAVVNFMDRGVSKLASQLTKGEKLGQYHVDLPIAEEATKQKMIKHVELVDKRHKALDGLTDIEKLETLNLMDQAKAMTKEETNKNYVSLVRHFYGDELNSALKALPKGFTLSDAVKVADDIIPDNNLRLILWNQSRDRANTTTKLLMNKRLGTNPKVDAAIQKLVSNNEEVAKEINNLRMGQDHWLKKGVRVVKENLPDEKVKLMIQGVPEGYDGPVTGLAGIDFHIDDVHAVGDRAVSGPGGDPTKLHRALSEDAADDWKTIAKELLDSGKATTKEQAEVMARNITYDEYARRLSSAFITKEQANAIKTVNRSRAAIKELPGVKKFDDFTGLLKQNLLKNSFTWLGQNYWDNIEKAYVNNGVKSAFDIARFKSIGDDLARDIELSQNGGNVHLPYKTDEVKDLMRLGVIDSNSLKDVNDMTDTERVLKGKNQIEAEKPNWVKRGEKWTDNPYSKLIGHYGGDIENRAKILTYQRVLGDLRSKAGRDLNSKALVVKGSKDAVDEQLKQQAAKIVKDTFFDYNSISAGEREIAKRLFPFYTFFSRNLGYWQDAVLDPNKIGRIAQADRVRTGFHRKPNERENKSLTNSYIKDSNPKLLRKDSDGISFISSPRSSVNDAMKTLAMPFELARGNFDVLDSNQNPILKLLHPTIKAGLEQGVFDKNSFFEQSFDPKENPSGTIPVGSGGYLGTFLSDAVEALGGKRNSALNLPGLVTGGLGTKAEKGRGPKTTSELSARLIHGLGSVPPVLPIGPLNALTIPAFKDLMKILYAGTHEDYDLGQSIWDTFGPVRITDIDARDAARTRKFNMIKEIKQKRLERKNNND